MTKAQIPGKLMIIWDYDGAAGNINASYPYKFDEAKIIREIENVETILRIAEKRHLKMTFACVGFGAEPGTYPYHIPDQIRRIRALGHEIASHSWRHEWFPFLEKEQIQLSLSRSKFALETCVGEPGSVTGFILPFSRPMSWYARGALSLGDRAFGPCYPGADLGRVLTCVQEAGYQWSRVSYRPIWQKFLPQKPPDLGQKWPLFRDLVCVPSHVFGFDEPARNLLERLSQEGGTLVVSAHPAALSFGREESLENFQAFSDLAAHHQEQGSIQSVTVQHYIQAQNSHA